MVYGTFAGSAFWLRRVGEIHTIYRINEEHKNKVTKLGPHDVLSETCRRGRMAISVMHGFIAVGPENKS